MRWSILAVIDTGIALALLAFGLSRGYAQVGGSQGVLDPNVATKEQLAKLPHLNEALVQRIADGRPFASMGKLNEALAKDLSEEQRKELYVKLFIAINLNAAPREEIQWVPGMTKKMLREFEEYRPYDSLERFRREIGKYVDKTEVARLEQYVFVPLDLNSASAEQIKTIPGVRDAVVKEIVGCRPYSDLEHFRHEIGKNCDAKELTRLERYFVVKANRSAERKSR